MSCGQGGWGFLAGVAVGARVAVGFAVGLAVACGGVCGVDVGFGADVAGVGVLRGGVLPGADGGVPVSPTIGGVLGLAAVVVLVGLSDAIGVGETGGESAGGEAPGGEADSFGAAGDGDAAGDDVGAGD